MASEDYLKTLISQVKRKKEEELEPAPPKTAEKEIPPGVQDPLKKGPEDFSSIIKRLKEIQVEVPEAPEIHPMSDETPQKSQPIQSLSAERESNPVPTVSSPAPAQSPPGDATPSQKPAEESTGTIEKEMETKQKVKLEEYGEVEIYKVRGESLNYYHVPVVRPTASEKNIINTLKEAATRLITIAPYKIRDPIQRRNVYYQRIMEILRASPELRISQNKFTFYANAVVSEMVGYGIIDPLIQDDKLEEIMIIQPKHPVYVFHREYGMMLTNIEFYSDNEIQDVVNRIAREVGRRVDISSPLLDARLPDGSRVNATIPPASVDGSTLTIRKFRGDPYSIVDLIRMGTLNVEAAAFLWLCVDGLQTRPANILIAGGTSSGKTTLLNVLCSFIPDSERVISIEDTAELSLPLKHWIRLEGRPPGLEGRGELSLDILTKNSLRMRPDRIIVGEIRHDEAFTLFTAMNTGHEGSTGTVHANSAQETIVRLTNPPMNVPEIMLSGLDFIIVENLFHTKKKGTFRRITEIAEVRGVLEGKAKAQTIFERDPVKDELIKLDLPIEYIYELQRLTGKTKTEMELEFKQREKALKEVISKGIRDMRTVSESLKRTALEGAA